jgi:hypothetical protein
MVKGTENEPLYTKHRRAWGNSPSICQNVTLCTQAKTRVVI